MRYRRNLPPKLTTYRHRSAVRGWFDPILRVSGVIGFRVVVLPAVD